VLRLFEPDGEAAWLRSFRFGAAVRPRYSDTNALGHVSNVALLDLLEVGRMQYLAAARDPEQGPFPFAHVTAEAHVRYVAECFYDEPLDVRTKLAALGRSSAKLEQAIVGAGESLRTLATVTIVRVDGKLPAPWTGAQRAALEAAA
jgi:acyl-CoA thioester hydrolase